MKINGRLLLLAAVIALFGRVWTTNDRTRVHPVVRNQYVARTEPARAHFPVIAAIPVSERHSVATPVAGPERWTTADCPLDLPTGMAAGMYRVVNDTGRIAELTVTEEEISDSQMPGSDSELYVITVGQERWYFIRLRTDSAPIGRQASRNAEPVSHLAPHPEFDLAALDPEFASDEFSLVADGEIEAGELEIPAQDQTPMIEEAARPAPPELPSPL